MIRWVQILKLTRYGALAVGYPRECGGWEVIEVESPAAPGFYAAADVTPYLAPGARTNFGKLVCVFPGVFGWVGILQTPDGTIQVDPFALEPERAGRFRR